MEPQLTRPMYKAHCLPKKESDKDEVFPDYFSFPPKVGDMVQSQTKRVYKITSIVHTAKITRGKYGDIQSPKAILRVEGI
jgi:hypothetical protein